MPYKQYKFPKFSTVDGIYQIILNAAGEKDFTQAAEDTLEITDVRVLLSMGELSQTRRDEDGDQAYSAIDFQFIDRSICNGIVDGSPVSEDYSPGTFFDSIFTDGVHIIWVTFEKNSTVDIFFYGTVRAENVDRDHIILNNEQTDTEEKKQAVRFSAISAAEELKSAVWSDVLDVLDQSDMINTNVYCGIIRHPFFQYKDSTDKNIWNERYPYLHAAPFWTGAGDDGSIGGGAADVYSPVDDQHPSLFFPRSFATQAFWDMRNSGTPDYTKGGTWVMYLVDLIELLCNVCNISFDPNDLDSALDFYAQEANNTTKFFDIQSSPKSLDSLCVWMNPYLGLHPYDGTTWDNPLRIQPDEEVYAVLKRFVSVFLSFIEVEVDNSTGAPSLVFIPRTDTSTGDFPQSARERVENSKESVTYSAVDFVQVKNTNDDTIVKCPSVAKGKAYEYEVGLRIRKWGDYESYRSFPVARANYQFSGNIFEQWKYFWGGFFPEDTDDREYGVDCWVAGLYLFYYQSSDTNIHYPSNWYPLSAETVFGTYSEWSGAYILSVVVRKGQSVPASPGDEYFNTLIFPAQILASDLVGQKQVIERSYGYVLGDSDNIRSLGPGITDQWINRGDVKTFKIIDIRRNLLKRSSEIKWVESVSPPSIDTFTYKENSSSSQTSSVIKSNSDTLSTSITQVVSAKSGLIDLSESIYSSVIDETTFGGNPDIIINDVVIPLTNTYEYTINNMPSAGYISEWMAVMTIGGNEISAIPSNPLHLQFVLNGSDVGSQIDINVTSGNYWSAVFGFNGQALAEGDVIGVKIWADNAGSLQMSYATIYIIPRIYNLAGDSAFVASITTTPDNYFRYSLTGANSGVNYSVLNQDYSLRIYDPDISGWNAALGSTTLAALVKGQRVSVDLTNAAFGTNGGVANQQGTEARLYRVRLLKYVRIVY